MSDRDHPCPSPVDVASELKRHACEAESEAARHRGARDRSAKLAYRLAIPAGWLAVLAGSSALAELSKWYTAGIAFASAGATTAMAVVDPIAARIDHGRKEADFADLARRARIALLELDELSQEERIAALVGLNGRRYRLDQRNPVRQSGPDGEPPPDAGHSGAGGTGVR